MHAKLRNFHVIKKKKYSPIKDCNHNTNLKVHKTHLISQVIHIFRSIWIEFNEFIFFENHELVSHTQKMFLR